MKPNGSCREHFLSPFEVRSASGPTADVSRRELLKILGAASTGALVCAGSLFHHGLLAQTASGGSARRFDLHHHFANPALLKLMNDKKTQGYQFWQPYTPAKSVEDMDKGGVQTSFISVTTPGIWFGNDQETRRFARELNEYGAKIVSDYPGRFGLFAVLPFPNANACLEEIEYAFGTLKAEGVGLLTSYSNRWLGDPSFAPVFQELNRRKAIVYTHAQVPDCCQSLMPGIPDTTVEYNTDTARTIISLIESGRALECPDITFIFSHGGGTILALPGRFLGAQASAAALAKEADPKSRLGQLRRFYYDTAGTSNPIQITALKQLVSTSQIVFGTDFPFGSSSNIATSLQTCGLMPAELRAIDRENALRILPKKYA
jgi:predicted TIM-barrel fold metal-dependent hydrolase